MLNVSFSEITLISFFFIIFFFLWSLHFTFLNYSFSALALKKDIQKVDSVASKVIDSSVFFRVTKVILGTFFLFLFFGQFKCSYFFNNFLITSLTAKLALVQICFFFFFLNYFLNFSTQSKFINVSLDFNISIA